MGIDMHEEARKALQGWFDGFNSKALKIERMVLCKRVMGWKRFERDTREGKLTPGSKILIYVEIKNFMLKEQNGKYTMHLSYDHVLLDEKDRRIAFPDFIGLPPSEKEDRLEFEGKVDEFYQTFLLTIPRDLPRGTYRINLTVKDEIGGGSATASLEVFIGMQ